MKFAYMIPLVAGAFAVSAGAGANAALPSTHAQAVIAAAPLAGGRDLGPATGGSRVDFSVVLPYRHAAELPALLKAQSDPKSPYFHRYMSAAQFRAYFAPAPAAYAAAAAQLKNSGFAVQTFANRTLLHAVGSAAAADALFQTRIDAVRQSNGALAYANVGRAIVPAALAGSHIVGLSNVIVAKTAFSQHLPKTPQQPLSTFGGTLVGPDGGFGPLAIDKAEDLPVEHGYTGANVNVADIIDGAVSDSDVAGFLSYFGIARSGPRTTKITVDGGCGAFCADGFTAALDAEWILAVAPGVTLFTYQIPELSNGGIADGFNAVVSDDAVNIVQFAVGACEINGGDLQLAIEPIIEQGAAEGITFESVAFGGANLCGLNIDLPMTPANLDTLTAVGASTAIVSTGGKLLAQSAFSDTSGGVAATISVPTWQASTPGVNPAGRNVPDVVLPGSVDGTGPSIYYEGEWQGGFAFVNNAPFAGYLATVQQYYGYATPLGNVAPALYSVFDAHGYGGVDGSHYYSDIKLGNIGAINGTPVLAKTGYDLATGIGSISYGYGLTKVLGY